MKQFESGRINVCVIGEGERLVLLPTSASEAERIYALTDEGCTLAAIDGIDWNYDLTPWAAKGVFKGRGDFGGGADALLSRLTGEIMPRLGASEYEKRYIAGYSLAGLFALYAVTRTDRFDGAASVSGSLWFDGFGDYFADAPVHAGRIWFSLGDAEKYAKNPRLAAVDACTRAAYERVRSLSVESVYVTHRGGHFCEPERRIAEAISWLINN